MRDRVLFDSPPAGFLAALCSTSERRRSGTGVLRLYRYSTGDLRGAFGDDEPDSVVGSASWVAFSVRTAAGDLAVALHQLPPTAAP